MKKMKKIFRKTHAKLPSAKNEGILYPFCGGMSMATTHSRKRSRSRPQEVLQKPRGVIHPRVQKVGLEHFGIVSVDCAKARSKWMLADFYGNVIIPPTVVEHNRAGLDAAIAQIRQALLAR